MTVLAEFPTFVSYPIQCLTPLFAEPIQVVARPSTKKQPTQVSRFNTHQSGKPPGCCRDASGLRFYITSSPTPAAVRSLWVIAGVRRNANQAVS